MPRYLTSPVVNCLVAILEKHKGDVPPPVLDQWKGMTDGQLWASVVGQIAVVGRAASGISLDQAVPNKDSWYQSLLTAEKAKRLRQLHTTLRAAGVRYVAKELSKCKKTSAAAQNFTFLASIGGPKRYFAEVAAIPHERWRIAIVADDLTYIKNKGARDLLIGLGQVQNAIALDTRILSVLAHCGTELPKDVATNSVKYKALESELLDKVCSPAMVTGTHFDRIIFEKYSQIVV